MNRKIVSLALVTVMALVAGGCFGDDDASDGPSTDVVGDGPAADVSVDADDGVDDCGQGQAWPDDPDFREAVCRPFMAMLDLDDVSGVPAWNERITAAILAYEDDRAGSLAELAAVTAEIEAAAG